MDGSGSRFTLPWAMEGLYPAARAAEIHPAGESWMHVEDVVFWAVPVYLSKQSLVSREQAVFQSDRACSAQPESE